jgi:hypothetical protein
MTDQEKQQDYWKSFVSLGWYDGVIEFLFRFVAKTSEPLLAAGIVYSAADVLSKGNLGSGNQNMENLWAISQALAIESSGGVVLGYGLQSIKEKDQVKAWMYLLLSVLLAFTGGVMLFMQLAGWEQQQVDTPLMLALFGLRCIVSVGYIYLCRTKSISFKNLSLPSEPPVTKPDPTGSEPPVLPPSNPPTIDYRQLAGELLPLLQPALRDVRATIVKEVKASITGPASVPLLSAPVQSQGSEPLPLLETTQVQNHPQIKGARTRTQRREQQVDIEKVLEGAYQLLLQRHPDQRISGRILAGLAKVNRQSAINWLKEHHPENDQVQRNTGSEQEIQIHQMESEPPLAKEPEPESEADRDLEIDQKNAKEPEQEKGTNTEVII